MPGLLKVKDTVTGAELKVVAEISVKKEIDLIAVIKELAEKSQTEVDDKIVEFLEKILKK